MADKPTTPTYSDLHITTAKIARTSILNLPARVEVVCTRVTGWEVWAMDEHGVPEERLGSEFGALDGWLVLDVAGHVICDGRKRALKELRTDYGSELGDLI